MTSESGIDHIIHLNISHMTFYLDESAPSEGGWIQWYCSLEDHSFFCEIPDEYIRSKFNLFGLKSQLKDFNEALSMVLDPDCPDDDDLEDEKFMQVYTNASNLYGLIHARYILTPRGTLQTSLNFIT